MSNCPNNLEISAYYDGELDAARAKELESHLANCPACAQELAELRGLSQVFNQAAQSPALHLSQIAMHRLYIKAEDEVEQGVLRMARWVCAVAAAILLVSGLWLGNVSQSGGSSSTLVTAPASPPPWAEVAVAGYNQTTSLDTGSPAAAWYIASARTPADSVP